MVSGPAKVNDKNGVVSIKRTTKLSNTDKTKVSPKHDESLINEEDKLKAEI